MKILILDSKYIQKKRKQDYKLIGIFYFMAKLVTIAK